jgi:hypothetical protein
MSALLGLNALPSLAVFVINPTVDLAGLSAPLRLTMTVTALLQEMLRLCSPLRTLFLAALVLAVVCPWVATVVNPLVPGSGSPRLVCPLVVTGETEILV